MASGLTGRGRMLEPTEILGHVRLALAQRRDTGRRGEWWFRPAARRSRLTRCGLSPTARRGKQGYALAQAALDRGARVTLVSGPSAAPVPVGAALVRVETAEEMARAVLEASAQADVLLMAAAVADFRPANPAEHKLKKQNVPEVTLEPTIDILSAVAEARERQAEHRPAVVVGFAAESQNLIENAREKVLRKRLALIAANDISAADAGFAVDTNRVTLIDAGGGVETLPLLTKAQVAEALLTRVEKLLAQQTW